MDRERYLLKSLEYLSVLFIVAGVLLALMECLQNQSHYLTIALERLSEDFFWILKPYWQNSLGPFQCSTALSDASKFGGR